MKTDLTLFPNPRTVIWEWRRNSIGQFAVPAANGTLYLVEERPKSPEPLQAEVVRERCRPQRVKQTGVTGKRYDRVA